MAEAKAYPDKRFFLDLITRDISLEDAILDLIDNAIDSLVRIKKISLYRDFLSYEKPDQDNSLPWVKVNFSSKEFTIEDNCGGISFDRARNDIFRFGHPDPQSGPSLSVFGIGMKRAIFKIGRQIKIESNSSDSGFYTFLKVDNWINIPGNDWTIPLEERSGENDPLKAGTKITITHLKEEVAAVVQTSTFQHRLIDLIQETYPFYLGRDLNIFINKYKTKGEDLSLGQSDSIKPAIEVWEDGHVKATMICGLLPRDEHKWKYEKSGWYILCNGRVIIYADKSRLTGWGAPLPQFMPKNRGFLGIVFLTSDQPEELPWNTTKRGINTESAVYIRTLQRMTIVARAVIQIQDKLYKPTGEDEPKEEYKESVNELRTLSATKQAAERSIEGGTGFTQSFSFTTQKRGPAMTSMQFPVKISDLERVKKSLGKVRMSNKEAGEKIFKYYFDRECAQ